ncbi:MAG: type VI secretion system baseplate subunit TssG [Rhodobacteraceae bacterium]|nr:type VI secretion system baseplate subunit TssG [Paracoccaceae bacterium]
MAHVAGQPRPDLTGDLAPPETMDFFELLRRLETPEARFGRAGGPEREPARLGQRARLAFATRDVAEFRPSTGKRPAEVDVEVLGLLGPEGALPLHLTRWVMARLSERWFAGGDGRATADTTFLDFANMLQHRMLALYWRAWADARGEVQAELGTGGRIAAMIDALAGIGLPGTKGAPAIDAVRRRHASALGHEVNGPERLTRLVADIVGAPVELVEFVGDWMEIPQGLQTRVGTAHARLGAGAVAGRRVFQRQTRAELRIGPVGLDHYLRIIGDGELRRDLREAIRFAAGREIDFDIRPVLSREAVPPPAVGRVQLGRTAWLAGPRQDDAADYRMARVTAGTGEAERRAA